MCGEHMNEGNNAKDGYLPKEQITSHKRVAQCLEDLLKI